MALLSISDFKMQMAVCELRYENAYLLYDRTGLVCNELKTLFTNLTVTNAAPSQIVLQADEGSFGLELGACRFTTQKPDNQLAVFASHSKRFFDSVLYNLDIKAFGRVGLRVFFRKDFKDFAEAKAALAALDLVNIEPSERFGAGPEPRELMLRWEGAELGATVRFTVGSGTIDVFLPPEIAPETPEIHKSISALSLDVDYYTMAPVERSQWDAANWITHSIRTIKKGTDSILGN